MRTTLVLTAIVLAAAVAAVVRRDAPDPQAFEVGGVQVVRAASGDEVLRPGQQPLSLPAADPLLRLRCGAFDPLQGWPVFAPPLRATGQRLCAVQFRTAILPEYRQEILRQGGEIVGYWPGSAYLVRADAAARQRLAAAPFVRWLGMVPTGAKLDPALQAHFVRTTGPRPHAVDCNVLLAERHERAAVGAAVAELGGTVLQPNEGSIYLVARMPLDRLVELAARDDVLWLDLATPIGMDLNVARIQGGANTVEFGGGLRGEGVRAQILEGLQQSHHDLLGRVLVQCDSQEPHGHCTAAIVGSSGAGNTNARGIMPACELVESSVFAWNGASRAAITAAAVDPAGPFRVMQATASWGHSATPDYTTLSADLDDILFRFDLATTQSQSNTGTQFSRPQAWAKNVIAVGGVFHQDTASPLDDAWGRVGATPASVGPASDGRIKPELCAYYDSVHCGDLLGVDGYSTGDYVGNFSGTSAATPLVNGFLGLAQQMFTDGLFGHALPLPATSQNRFFNKPHMTTAKALLCSTAASYAFAGSGHDLARTHQGWGFPAVDRLFAERGRMLVVDESETLTQGQSRTYYVYVAPGTPEFRATMAYADPFALPSAAVHRVNSLDLRVRRFDDGVEWWGNHGLDVGNQSLPGGGPNDLDTLEQVWLAAPRPGIYMVTVSAPTVVADGHAETAALDVDFALCAHPMGGGYRTPSSLGVELQSNGPGDLRLQPSNVPAAGWTEGFTFVSMSTSRPLGFGNFFGVEFDGFVDVSLNMYAAVGDPFHFSNAGPAFYPYRPFVVPPAVAHSLRGASFDVMMMLFDGAGQVVSASKVARTTVL